LKEKIIKVLSEFGEQGTINKEVVERILTRSL